MANPVLLRLKLIDVYGKTLTEDVDVMLRHQELSEIKRATVTSKKFDIAGLRGAPQGRYRIDVDPPSYQYVARFINLKGSGTTTETFIFPIDPDKVTGVIFPQFEQLSQQCRELLDKSHHVLAFVSDEGQSLYAQLDDVRKAGLLNIITKSAATKFPNGRNVLSYIQDLLEIRGDRFFAKVDKDLREETKNSTNSHLFHEANESLHHPPPNFTSARSYKTQDRYGNLQLSFFMNGDECVADIDIDDAGGFEHIFQVIRNKLSGQPTHPYNIHDILVGFQKIDPGYSFLIS
jgi:hypothetical protein